MSLKKEDTLKIVKDFGANEKDTGRTRCSGCSSHEKNR